VALSCAFYCHHPGLSAADDLADDDGRDVDDDGDRLDYLLDGLVDHVGPNDPASERLVMTCD
jgi:hypothetical protein